MTISGNKTINQVLVDGVKYLSENKSIELPRLDCEIFLTHILKCKRIDLIMNNAEFLSSEVVDAFYEMVKKRKKNMPVSYITNSKEFMSLDFYVEEGILIPRPETELLVECVINHFKCFDKPKILDLCTGSGAIAVSTAYYLKNAVLTAVDKYDICIDVAKKNAKKHSVTDRIEFKKYDVLSEPNLDKGYDCIVSNPPYIKSSALPCLSSDVKDYEPEYALDGGNDGLIFYEKITRISKTALKNGGLLAFEIGFDQGNEVKKIIEKTGIFYSINIQKDYAGLDRIVTAIKGII